MAIYMYSIVHKNAYKYLRLMNFADINSNHQNKCLIILLYYVTAHVYIFAWNNTNF